MPRERGQVAVFLVFGIVALTGMAWLVIATGDRVESRQQLQTGADSAAWGGAVVTAGSLNLLARANDLMAAFLAASMTVHALKDVMTIVEASLAGACASCFVGVGCQFCPWIPTADQARQFFDDIEEPTDEITRDAMVALMEFQDAIVGSEAIPGLAELAASAEAGEVGRQNAPRRATVGPWPAGRIPVRRGNFGELCDRAIDKAGDMVGALLPWPLDSFAVGVAERSLETFRGHYCGQGGASTHTEEVEVSIPARPDPDVRGAGCAPCLRRQPSSIRRAFLTAKVTCEPASADGCTGVGEKDALELEGFLWRDQLPCASWLWRCESDSAQCVQTSKNLDGAEVRREWTLDACTTMVEQTVTADYTPPGGIAPLEMQERWLSDGLNQVRAVALEGDHHGRRRQAVGVALGGHVGEREGSRGRAVAQAEFWTSAAVGDELWSMGWRAYLRRFYLDQTAAVPAGVSLPEMNEWMLH